MPSLVKLEENKEMHRIKLVTRTEACVKNKHIFI